MRSKSRTKNGECIDNGLVNEIVIASENFLLNCPKTFSINGKEAKELENEQRNNVQQ